VRHTHEFADSGCDGNAEAECAADAAADAALEFEAEAAEDFRFEFLASRGRALAALVSSRLAADAAGKAAVECGRLPNPSYFSINSAADSAHQPLAVPSVG
jgi:hypothetical protein